MEFRHLGNTGLIISEIAYGNWITHGSQVEEDTATSCVRAALDAGITTFDTADGYAQGKAEEILGRALKGERRDGLEIFSKLYWPMGEGKNDRGLSRKHVVRGCEDSLRRLGTDYLDLYQAHRFDYTTPLEETMRAFEDLVRQGKVLYIGVSEWRAEEIERALKIADEMGFDRIVSNQPQYNMLWRVIESEVVPLSEREGLGQIVWSPIAGGILTGKYKPGQELPAGSRAADPKSEKFLADKVSDQALLERVQGLEPLAAEAGLSLSQLAVAWVLQNRNVSTAIIGASRPEQVRSNVEAAGVKLDAGLMARIDEVLGDSVQRDPALTKSPENIRG
ncbi:aldo/keto reductase family protein [Nocardiopsis listeri]|uniref:aldo/keto reductase family protein n=1 Tax=Nocardiopsis listeri TaxID=53440 RepID=UPI000833B228|nr:aldo/keto reductase family protein [Nocardiopsis listeri]